MTDFGKHLFEMGKALVKAQAESDRIVFDHPTEPYGVCDTKAMCREGLGGPRTVIEVVPQDPSTLFTCKNCGKPSLGTGWFPFCSIWCSAEFKEANQ